MRRRLPLAVGVACIALGCGHDNDHLPPPSLVVTSLTIQGPTRIAPGDTATLQAIAKYNDGSTKVVTQAQWHSSDAFSFPITDSGQITAKRTGEATVTAAYFKQAATTVMGVPPGTFRLAGKVLEAGLPLVSADVKVTSGQGTGLITGTDEQGQYRLYGVAGPVDVQVSKLGYTTETKAIAVATDDVLDFTDMAQAGSVASLTGTYTLTLTMASDCFPSGATVPAEARTRTYTAAVMQDGIRLVVSLSGAKFLLQSGQGNAFEGRVEPGGNTFHLGSLGGFSYGYYGYHYGVPNLAEILSTGDCLTYVGSVFAVQSPAGIAGQLNGSVLLFNPRADGTPNIKAECSSFRHQFSLTPQTAARARR